MADTLDVRIIPEFNGTSQPVTEWFEKAELVCQLRNIKSVETVIPLRLTGGAFAVHQQLSESEKKDIKKVKEALYSAFSVDQFVAYESFTARRLKSGEAVDVYLADLRRLSLLFGGVSETALACAFVAGLPDAVRQLLRAGTRIEAMTLSQILERARAVLTEDSHSAAAVIPRQSLPRPRDRVPVVPQNYTCFNCGLPNHLARDCLLRSRRRRGVSSQGNASVEGASAPVSSPEQ